MNKYNGKRNNGTWLFLGIILLALYAAYIPKVNAETSITFGGVSHHFITEDYENSMHNTLAITYNKVMVGYFKNSYDNDSFIAGYAFNVKDEKYFTMDLIVAAVRGYDKCYGKFTDEENRQGKSKIEVCPMLAPTFIFKVDYPVKPQLTLFGDALTLSANYKF